MGFWRRGWWQKIALLLPLAFLLLLLVFLGVGRWYVASTSNQPLRLGATFVADYARSLGVDADETLDALITDIGVRDFRLVSYWNKIEATPGTYDFSELDSQFAKIEAAEGTVTLAIGLRQPRWPECHEPAWAHELPDAEWRSALESFIAATTARYKDSPSLISYQLENEFQLKVFGECRDFSRERVQAEFDLVRSIDPNTPIIISRSNNSPSIIAGDPMPDVVGFSIYRRVWSQVQWLWPGYFTYPAPSWYYSGLAGLQKIFTGRDSVIHELQMEPWPPEFVANVSQEEQDKSMNAAEFAPRVEFAKQTGMREIYLWGAEWWYYRKVILGDDSLWQEAARVFADN